MRFQVREVKMHEQFWATASACLLRSTLVALLVCFPIGSSAQTSARGGQTTWEWLFTGPLADKWDVETGKTTITVDGTKLTAELATADHPNVVLFTVTGTITGNQMKVRVTRLHTDVGGSYDFTGRIVTRPVKGFADFSAIQTIVMYEPTQHQLGFTRTVPK